MRTSKARTGHSTGCACHRRWSVYGMSGEYRETPSNTRGGSRMPELGPYGSMRGARGNSRPYRDQRLARKLNGYAAFDPLCDMVCFLPESTAQMMARMRPNRSARVHREGINIE